MELYANIVKGQKLLTNFKKCSISAVWWSSVYAFETHLHLLSGQKISSKVFGGQNSSSGKESPIFQSRGIQNAYESWRTNVWIKKQTKTPFNRQKYALLKNKIQEISMLQGISKIILWKYLIQEPLSKIMFCLIFWSCSTHHSFSVTKRPSNF